MTAPTKLPASEAEQIARGILTNYARLQADWSAGGGDGPPLEQWLLWEIVDKLQAAYADGQATPPIAAPADAPKGWKWKLVPADAHTLHLWRHGKIRLGEPT